MGNLIFQGGHKNKRVIDSKSYPKICRVWYQNEVNLILNPEGNGYFASLSLCKMLYLIEDILIVNKAFSS